MITLEKVRKKFPEAFEGLDDEESQQVLTDLYVLADIAFDMWLKEKEKNKATRNE